MMLRHSLKGPCNYHHLIMADLTAMPSANYLLQQRYQRHSLASPVQSRSFNSDNHGDEDSSQSKRSTKKAADFDFTEFEERVRYRKTRQRA